MQNNSDTSMEIGNSDFLVKFFESRLTLKKVFFPKTPDNLEDLHDSDMVSLESQIFNRKRTSKELDIQEAGHKKKVCRQLSYPEQDLDKNRKSDDDKYRLRLNVNSGGEGSSGINTQIPNNPTPGSSGATSPSTAGSGASILPNTTITVKTSVSGGVLGTGPVMEYQVILNPGLNFVFIFAFIGFTASIDYWNRIKLGFWSFVEFCVKSKEIRKAARLNILTKRIRFAMVLAQKKHQDEVLQRLTLEFSRVKRKKGYRIIDA